MKTNLWLAVMDIPFERKEYSEILEFLKAQGIELNNPPEEDPFFVGLCYCCGSMLQYVVEECQVFKDLTQPDGEIYPLTIRLPNGYDLSLGVGRDEVYTQDGSCVSHTPAIAECGNGYGKFFIELLSALPQGEHLEYQDEDDSFQIVPLSEMEGSFNAVQAALNEKEMWGEFYLI